MRYSIYIVSLSVGKYYVIIAIFGDYVIIAIAIYTKSNTFSAQFVGPSRIVYARTPQSTVISSHMHVLATAEDIGHIW